MGADQTINYRQTPDWAAAARELTGGRGVDHIVEVGGADTFQSLPVGLMPDGTFYSYWYMPYGKKAHIEVGNDGPAPVAMTWQVSHAPLDQPIDKLARFHAKWHRDAFLPERPDRVIFGRPSRHRRQRHPGPQIQLRLRIVSGLVEQRAVASGLSVGVAMIPTTC